MSVNTKIIAKNVSRLVTLIREQLVQYNDVRYHY